MTLVSTTKRMEAVRAMRECIDEEQEGRTWNFELDLDGKRGEWESFSLHLRC